GGGRGTENPGIEERFVLSPYGRAARSSALSRRLTLSIQMTSEADMTASPMPAATSSQKWFPPAITVNNTNGGHSAQRTFGNLPLTSPAMTRPMMSPSAAWMLGIAAYWFEASWTRPAPGWGG